MVHKKNQTIIDFYDIESPYVTEFRRLLHNLLDSSEKRDIKFIMLTSAMLSEGKSTICSFLAITSALKKGMKTLIIDSDLRRPSINKFFKLQDNAGLYEILVEGYNPRDAINATSIDKLDVLTTGAFCKNPAEVFDAEAIGSLIEEMKFYYDLILIDTAPLLPVSDPMMLASKVDGVLLVVKAGSTQKDVVRRAVGILNPDQNNILGVAFNNMNHSLPYYYDYSYYHYEYNNSQRKARRGSEKKKHQSSKPKIEIDK